MRLPRVVVIRERAAGAGLHGHVHEPVVLEDRLRDLLARHPVRDGDLHLPLATVVFRRCWIQNPRSSGGIRKMK